MLGLTAGVPEFEGSGPNRDQSSAVQCVVDEYGPTDFTQSYSKSVDAARSSAEVPWRRSRCTSASPTFDQVRSTGSRQTPRSDSRDSWHGGPIRGVRAIVDGSSSGLSRRVFLPNSKQLPAAGHGFKGADAARADDPRARIVRQVPRNRSRCSIRCSSPIMGRMGEIAEIDWPSGKVLSGRCRTTTVMTFRRFPTGMCSLTINPQKKVVEVDADHKEV